MCHTHLFEPFCDLSMASESRRIPPRRFGRWNSPEPGLAQDIFLHQKQLGNFKEGDTVTFGVLPAEKRGQSDRVHPIFRLPFGVGPPQFGHVGYCSEVGNTSWAPCSVSCRNHGSLGLPLPSTPKELPACQIFLNKDGKPYATELWPKERGFQAPRLLPLTF